MEKQFTQGIGGSKVKHVKTIADLYKQYLDKFKEYHIPNKSQLKQHTISQSDIINPFDKQNKIKDYKLKPLKQFYRPYFSKSLGSWEIDIVFDGKQDYLFCININTKYLVVYEIQNKTSVEILRCLDQLIKQQHVTNLRSDGESAIGSKMVQDFLSAHHISYYMSKSKFTNRNRVVDRVIRTIRDAFIGQDMANPKLMQQIVKLYNDKLHSAFDLKYSPSQVNKDEDLEGKYIRSQMKKLNEAKQSQSQLTKLTKGNIILIHLDLSKTALKFNKQRRQFNELAIFEKYQHGNIICRLLKPYKDIQQVEIPIYFAKKVSDDIENLDDKYKSTFLPNQNGTSQ
ncbi:MAG: hypothetical protein EZS28_037479 [Streblomastix strix]|uniref:Integrase catalytic domain-containing protein n=1 Tax=Streblomastix strix TaxID=222440 RepID=A0A5J4UBJ9_9EUKA|nr:MAG: hypothetical protein EZS28_037479 [Streblomastix strix]